MARKPLTQQGVDRMRKREASVGIESDDDAAKWLDEHDPKPKPPESKSAFKSKTLHRWRKQQGR
jgi:hypothetical protein